MRKYIISAIALFFCASSANAQSSSNSSLMGQPFVAGNQGLFTTALLNLNLVNFFGGLLSDGTTIRSNGLFAPQYAGLRANQIQNVRLSNFGVFGQQTVLPSNSTQAQLYVVLTGLDNSKNLRSNSTGLLITSSGNSSDQDSSNSLSSIQSVSFEYSPLSGTTGLVTGDYTQAPMLAVTDQGGARTRFFPVTSGLLATNASLNQYSNAFNTGSGNGLGTTNNLTVTPTTSLTTADALNAGFLTAVFTPAQLNLQGTVTALGLIYGKSGIVLINNLSVNGSTISSFSTDIVNGFPFSGQVQQVQQ